MAIVKMKHLRLAAMQSDREALLRLLQGMGCLEIEEPSVDWSDPEWAGLKSPDSGALSAAREEKNAAQHALEVLKRYAKVKGGLLSPRPVVSPQQFLEEQAIANKKLSEGQIAEVKALLENATAQLESIKTDLSEKVHSENVKCYRNIQDLFNEFDSKIEKMDEMEQGVGSVKGYVKCLSWFAILNFVVLIGFILYSLGVFNF